MGTKLLYIDNLRKLPNENGDNFVLVDDNDGSAAAADNGDFFCYLLVYLFVTINF